MLLHPHFEIDNRETYKVSRNKDKKHKTNQFIPSRSAVEATLCLKRLGSGAWEKVINQDMHINASN